MNRVGMSLFTMVLVALLGSVAYGASVSGQLARERATHRGPEVSTPVPAHPGADAPSVITYDCAALAPQDACIAPDGKGGLWLSTPFYTSPDHMIQLARCPQEDGGLPFCVWPTSNGRYVLFGMVGMR